jgi:hypothetical protein
VIGVPDPVDVSGHDTAKLVVVADPLLPDDGAPTSVTAMTVT